MSAAGESPILRVDALSKRFELSKRVNGQRQYVHALDEVSFELNDGETLAIVGESGCGKSTLGRLVMRLIEPTAGSILFEGKDLTRVRGRNLLPYRRKLQMVFQDPYGSLNPRMSIKAMLKDLLKIHGIARGAEADRRIAQILETVGLPAASAQRYPHEFSGGQRQRIGIARALIVDPSIIVCDEAVSALDVSVQAQIINLLADIQREFGLSYIFISHDLMLVQHMADRIAVMSLGRIVETGDTETIFSNPRHPYTRALLDVIPVPGAKAHSGRQMREGDVPNPVDPPSGCQFHPRCPFAQDRCTTERPHLLRSGASRVACHRRDELPPWEQITSPPSDGSRRLERLQAAFTTGRESEMKQPREAL